MKSYAWLRDLMFNFALYRVKDSGHITIEVLRVFVIYWLLVQYQAAAVSKALLHFVVRELSLKLRICQKYPRRG